MRQYRTSRLTILDLFVAFVQTLHIKRRLRIMAVRFGYLWHFDRLKVRLAAKTGHQIVVANLFLTFTFLIDDVVKRRRSSRSQIPNLICESFV
jgi:hypothetical protein